MRASHLVVLLLILLAATLLRVHRLTAQSLWHDEFITLELTGGRGYARLDVPLGVILQTPPPLTDLSHAKPIWSIWAGDPREMLPPLYIVLMRLWGECFGQSDAVARGFSVAVSVAAVAIIFIAVRALSGPTAALWAAALMALAGSQIQFAQEARAYALLVLLGLCGAAALGQMQRTQRPRWSAIAFAAALLAMMLTHYFAAGTALALCIFAVVRLRGVSRRRALVAIAVAAVLFVVVWGPQALRQLQHFRNPHLNDYVRDDTPGHVGRALFRTAVLPVRLLVDPRDRVRWLAVGGAVAYLAIIPALRHRPDLLLWALWLPLTILPIALLDITRRTQHLELLRYTVLATPAVCALVAGAASNLKGWRAHLPPAVVTLACLLALPAPYHAWWKPGWRELGSAVGREMGDGDILIISTPTPQDEYPHNALLALEHYRGQRLPPVLLVRERPSDAVLAQLRSYRGILHLEPPGSLAPPAFLPMTEAKRVWVDPWAGRLTRMALTPQQ